MVTLPRSRIRGSAALLLGAALFIHGPGGSLSAGAVEDEPVLYIVPLTLAPLRLDGEFPVTLTTKAGVIEGTLALSLGADGALVGSLDLDGGSFAVTGTQSFKNGRGSIALEGTGATGTLKWKGKVSGNSLSGKCKGAGTLLQGTGTLAVDASDADPLEAHLDLTVSTGEGGTLGGTGLVVFDDGSTVLDVTGSAGRTLALAASAPGFAFTAKGKPFSLGGWIVNGKAAGRGCTATLKGFPLAAVETDLTGGATLFAGPYPDPGMVTLPASEGGGQIPALPGQVVVFFDPGTAPSSVGPAVTGAGGTVLGSIPATGRYLVSVGVGTEGAFMDAIGSSGGFRYALPNCAGQYMASSSAVIIDGCEAASRHGKNVISVFKGEGGHDASCADDDNGGGAPVLDRTVGRLEEYARNHQGLPLLVNISSSGVDDKGWYEYMKGILAAIAGLPEDVRNRLAVTMCAGNFDLDLSQELALLRSDPRLADVLSRNVLIAGASTAVYPGSNDSTKVAGVPTDADFLLFQEVGGPSGNGTSYAAPRGLAMLQRIVDLLGVSPTFALKAAKEAAKRNAKHEIVYDELKDVAYELLGTSPAAVYPAELKFEVVEGDPAPPAKMFTIANLAGVGANVTFTVTGAGQWLKVPSPSGSVKPHSGVSVDVSVQPAGLAPGTYVKDLSVRGKAGNEFATVMVELTVKPVPTYSGDFAADMGSHTTVAGCTFGLDLSGTLNLRPREGTGGAALGDGDTDADLGVFVTYTPSYTYCTASPFTEHRTGTISGTKANLSISLSSGAGFTMDFTGTWSGDTITGSATWNQRYLADGDYVYKTGSIPSLILTKQP